jgi:hypothetical protein
VHRIGHERLAVVQPQRLAVRLAVRLALPVAVAVVVAVPAGSV